MMSVLLSLWLVHAAPLNQWMPGDLVSASARGAIRGLVEARQLDDRPEKRAPVKSDGDPCRTTPLVRGCM